MKRIIISIIFLNLFLNIFSDDGSAIYGVFINDGVEKNSDIQNVASITSFLSFFCGSLEVKNTLTSFQEINCTIGFGLGNVIQIQGGFGTEGFLLKLNSDFPIGKTIHKLVVNHDFNIFDNDYQYCRENWYKRINLNSNIKYYFRSNNFTYSIGLGYLIY